ncbi:MAG: chemotaxis response regulator protein-glutamate methylesterase, partial [Alphaproteobacteria bacterium]
AGSRTCVLVTSITIDRNLPLIFDALKAGAVDFVRSPTLPYSPGTPITPDALRAAGAKLLHKIRTVLSILDRRRASVVQDAVAHPCAGAIEPAFSAGRESFTPDAAVRRLVAIGCSTGGPTTLAVLLSALPRPLPAPVLICQHIEPDFTTGFVDWLARETNLPVDMTRDRTEPQLNHVYVAPGGQYNLAVTASGRLLHEPAMPGQIHVPNIDHLFRTMAEQLEDRACGVILTGMGDDGARGLRTIKERGGGAFVQDEQSAIIPSMPRTALRVAGLERGYPLESLARLLSEWMNQ